ncbi:MAG: Uma2 family endonuclease [Janthinobacterium lividum]
MSAQPLPYYTLEQYVELEENATYKSEFVAGRIYAMSGGTPKHSLISGNIILGVGSLLRGSPCKVYTSDLRVGIMPIDVETYPDVAIVCGEPHINPFDKNSIINPAVIFEVLSPSTERYDRGEKWARYQRLDSLQQYVLVSQDTPRVEHYVRQEDGSWNYAALEGLEPASALRVLDVRLALSEIYDRITFPEPSDVREAAHAE